eukprot:6711287-Ditylum_brightwellii.AAC.1
MESTDGLVRGQKCVDSSGPIQVPVCQETFRRIINMIGEPVDKMGPIFPNKETEKFVPLHRSAPTFTKQRKIKEILVTGTKVVDLLTLYAKGGKIGLFDRAGVRKMVVIMELMNNIAMNHRSYSTFARVGEHPHDLTLIKQRSTKKN